MKTACIFLPPILILALALLLGACSEEDTTEVDTTPPSVSVIEPAANETVSIPVTVKVSASDNSGVARVDFFANDIAFGFDTTEPYERVWNPGRAQAIADTLRAIAIDDAGNYAISSPVIILRDTTAPDVAITAPIDGTELEGPVTVMVSVSDNLEVERVDYWVDGDQWIGMSDEAPYSRDWNVGVWADGASHSLTAKAKDPTGNVGESTILVTISTLAAPPEVVITQPVDDSEILNESVEVLVTVTDTDEVVGISYYVDDEFIGESAEDPFSIQWDVLFWADNAEHILVAEAEDERGNLGYSAPISVVIDITAGLDLIAPADETIFTDVEETTLEWQLFESAVAYEYMVALDSLFERIELNDIIEESSLSLSDLDHEWFYWRVRAQNSLGRWSEWSPTWRFHVGVIFSSFFIGNFDDEAYSVQELTDGGFVIAGVQGNSDGGGVPDLLIAKADAMGNELWMNSFGNDSLLEVGYCAKEMDDGFIVGGLKTLLADAFQGDYSTERDLWLVKTDPGGNMVWDITYGDTGDESAQCLDVLDDGIIVAGYTSSFGAGDDDVWLLKTDASGDTLWTRTYGGARGDVANYIEETSDGGFVMAGYTESFDGVDMDYWVIKTDAQGQPQWTYRQGGAMDDWATCVRQTEDGGYIVSGYSESFGAGETDLLLIRLDAGGGELWARTHGGNGWEGGDSVVEASNGDFVVTGYIQPAYAGQLNFWLMRTNESGEFLWDTEYGDVGAERGLWIEETPDEGLIIAGFAGSFTPGGKEAWLLKTDGSGNTVDLEEGQ